MRGASRGVAAALLAATLLSSSCTSGGGNEIRGATAVPAEAGSAPECQTHMQVPRGFRVVSHQHVEYDDHVGSRLRSKASGGRTLFFNVGIPGEFAEGAELRGVISVLDGHEGNLYGAGSVWILTWNEGGPCGANVVIGNGFSRGGFLATLTGSGLTNAQP